MRGTPGHPCQGTGRRRFIPAYAGNTCTCTTRCRMRAVHPRVCGEHPMGRVSRSVAAGSSPRMRGTPGRHRLRCRCHRFIPAYAGNTALAAAGVTTSTVHPRVCGEHGVAQRAALGGYGSSPRMRGTQLSNCSGNTRRRFIPAYAGNTHRRLRRTPDPAVHPRVCGEHVDDAMADIAMVGSSPRMRGTLMAVEP